MREGWDPEDFPKEVPLDTYFKHRGVQSCGVLLKPVSWGHCGKKNYIKPCFSNLNYNSKSFMKLLINTTQDLLNRNMLVWDQGISLQPIWVLLSHNQSWEPLKNVHSVRFICSVMSDSLRPHESQHARPPCPSPSPGGHSDSRPSSLWCHRAISSSVVPFSSCPQSLQHQSLFQWVSSSHEVAKVHWKHIIDSESQEEY